jgi:twitching motility two-component system response regulator PilH
MVQSHPSGATKNTVLVVDDSTTMRSMVQSFLSQDEFHVQVAKSGQEGLTRIQEHCPDLLLLDFIMPGMNGYEVYIHLREQPAYADLPIVIMSGSKVEVFNKFAESKVEQKFVFLSKPFDPETLRKQIALALELRLIPTTVEEVVVQEEVPLELPNHEPILAEEVVALQDEPMLHEEIVVTHEAMLPHELIVPDPISITVHSEVAPQEETVLHLSDNTAEMSIAQIPMEVAHEYYSYEQPKETVVEVNALSHEPYAFPVLEEASLPMPVEAVPSILMESAEIPVVQIAVEPERLEHVHEQPVEKVLVARLGMEEPTEISKPQAPIENASLDYIHQNLAHILNMESYVMSALQNLDERSAEDMRSIKNLADHTTLLQQEFLYVRGILNDLTKLPEQIETLREQVLIQSQVSSDKAEQEHLTMVGDRFNSVDAVLLQSVVTLDRLEEIQAGLRETIHTSYGQLSDRLTAIERRFEAIVVRPPDPVPVLTVPVVSSTKSYMSPLVYVTIALGALNLGAMVALLLR